MASLAARSAELPLHHGPPRQGTSGASQRQPQPQQQQPQQPLRPQQRLHPLDHVLLKLLSAAELLTRAIGPLLLMLASCIISLATWTYFDAIMPGLGIEAFSLPWLVITALGVWILVNLSLNYASAVMTPPGCPSELGPGQALSNGGAALAAGSAATAGGRDVEAGAGGSSDYAKGAEGGAGAGAGAPAAAPHSTDSSSSSSNARGFVLDPTQSSWCKKCNAEKPPRTHHCHVCGKCVLKMDHHCPWISNCCGWGNYHFFFKLLFYAWVGCLFICSLTAFPFWDSMQGASSRWKRLQEEVERTAAQAAAAGGAAGVVGELLADGTAPGRLAAGGIARPRLPLLADLEDASPMFAPAARVNLCFVLCLAIGVGVGALFAWHVFLISTAQTSIEFQQNRTTASRLRHRGQLWRNPFDLGVKRNWQAVFGNGPWYTWLLPYLGPPPGNGRAFTSVVS